MANYTAQSREAGRAPLPISERKDDWWVGPLYTVVVLTAFGIYTTFRAFENNYFCWPWSVGDNATVQAGYRAVEHATYLSPFYSPYLPIALSFGTFAVSPAFYILIFPLAFRLTCYYYRKAYYRAFFWDPPACAVSEPRPESRMRYTGERVFPFILQNLHRFAFYIAAIFIFILGWDAIKAFMWTKDGATHFGIGLGTIILVLNVVALAAYTFGCHSWRHLVGGSTNCYSCSNAAKTRYGLWKQVSFLNSRHSLYAWTSLYTVALADLYVRLVAAGVIPDPHIIF